MSAIAPLSSARSQLRLDADRATRKLEHWRHVVESACTQSGRALLPGLASPRPLAEFVLADTKEFLADGERGYAQAWALIHFLRHVDAEGQRAMQQLWTAVSSGTDGSEAIANALPDHAMGALQERFIRWLRLQRPR